LLVSGCIERRLFVRVEPVDAMVTLDGRRLVASGGAQGRYDEPFEFYGTRALTVRRRGYKTLVKQLELEAPWHSIFPLDLLTELLWPGTIEDHRYVELELDPSEGLSEADKDALIERGRALGRDMGADFDG